MNRPVLLLMAAMLITGLSDTFSQENREIELTAQGILARVDNIMAYPEGMIKGKIKHIRPTGESFSFMLTGYIDKEDFLFRIRSPERGEQLKILYNLGGEDIWVYDILSIKLFHKLGIDRYDPILMTNFFFIDLSNADLQSNYSAKIIDANATVYGKDAYKLELTPIFKGGQYGLLTLYVTRDKFLPLRIDYHDRDQALFKFMRISKIWENEKDGRIIPKRYDMLDIKSGTLTIISFFGFDEEATFDKEIFRSEKLGE